MWIIALLAVMLAIVVHRTYLRKSTQTRWEYKADEGEKIDLQSLQSAGADGWDCAIVPTSDGTTRRYIVLCKRPVL